MGQAVDLTIIYITANRISEEFAQAIRGELLRSCSGLPIISVSKQPLSFGRNLCFPGEASIFNEYSEALEGAKAATTRLVAIAEDDCLYSPAHFQHDPKPGHFAYNLSCWSLFTWVRPPQFNWNGRHNHNGLVCERELYIAAMEERITRYPAEVQPVPHWSEPGRYERQLGLTVHPIEDFFTNPANIRFSHQMDSYGWRRLGRRKKMGALRAYDIPYWGRAEEVLKRYA